jgi:hypothetical protein
MDIGRIGGQRPISDISHATRDGAQEIAGADALHQADTLSLTQQEDHPLFLKITGADSAPSGSPPGAPLPSAASDVASRFVPGPGGALIAQQMKMLAENKVEFFLKKRFRIPGLQKEADRIDSDEAARILKDSAPGASERLEARIGGEISVPSFTPEDASDLTSFLDLDGMAPVKEKDLLAALKEAEKNGMEFTVRGTRRKGAYNAYRHLIGRKVTAESAGMPVDVKQGEATILSITQEARKNLSGLKSGLQDALGQFQKLKNNKTLWATASEPIGNVPLDKRADILLGIYRHAENYDIDNAEKASKSYGYLRDLAAEKGDFAALGAQFVEMLDAYDDKNWNDGYKDGLKLIATKLRGNPEDYRIFIDLLKHKVPPSGAVQLFEMLPSPPGKGEFEKAAQVFKSGELGGSAAVKLIFPPNGSSALKERYDIACGIYRHAENYEISNFDQMAKGYNYLESLAAEKGDFAALGAQFVEMLDAYDDKNWNDGYKDGLKLIATKLRDNPEDYRVFIDLLKHKVPPSGAVQLYEMLPSPPGKGEFEKAAQVFKSGELGGSAAVKLIFPPNGSSALKERYDIACGIYRHAENYEISNFDQMAKGYRYLQNCAAGGEEFAGLGTLYVEMLDALNQKYWDSKFNDAFDFARQLSVSNPSLKDSLMRLLRGGRGAAEVLEAFKAIQSPVKDESYEMREKAAAHLLGSSFSFGKKYDMLCRNPLPGESLEDTAKLLAALLSSYREDEPQGCEDILRKVEEKLPPLTASQAAELAGAFSCANHPHLLDAMEILKNPVRGETFEARKNFFLELSEDRSQGNLNRALQRYGTCAGAIDGRESFEEGAGRFMNIARFITGNEVGTFDDAVAVFDILGRELKAGTFGAATPDEITAELLQILLLEKNPKDAASRLVSSYAKPDGTGIVDEENEIYIDGIRIAKSH